MFGDSNSNNNSTDYWVFKLLNYSSGKHPIRDNLTAGVAHGFVNNATTNITSAVNEGNLSKGLGAFSVFIYAVIVLVLSLVLVMPAWQRHRLRGLVEDHGDQNVGYGDLEGVLSSSSSAANGAANG